MNRSWKDRISGLYAVTPDENDTVELLRKVRLALLGGARLLQYRNKISNREVHLEQSRALRDLTYEFEIPLIINDDVMLALETDADGVHLGSSDGSLDEARKVLGSGKIIGMSCYNRLELAHESEKQGADYVAFGSFFASMVKPEAVIATTDLLRQAHGEISLPIVAIGGITVNNGTELLEAGADALAVISALFGAGDIRQEARRFADLKIR